MILSVIVPVYNGESFIRRCIDSIEKAFLELPFSEEEILRECEIIIVNDGSSDNTGEECTRLSFDYKNIQIITLNDEGVSVARNAALNEAEGKYISFVDADDIVDKSIFSILYKVAEDNSADITGCQFFQWNEEADFINHNTIDDRYSIKKYDSETYLSQELINGNTRCWSKLYLNSTIKNIRFMPGLTIGEDMLFLAEAVKNSMRIAEVPDFEGYGYYKNQTGAMNRPFTPQYMDQIRSWEYLKKIVGSETDSNNVLLSNVDSKLLISIMLVVSKIAILPKNRIGEYKQEIDICHEKLLDIVKNKVAMRSLEGGYRIKVGMFAGFPRLYINLYHLWKCRG